VKDGVPSPDVIEGIQRDALSHLERTSQSVIEASETLRLLGEEVFSPPIRDRLIKSLASEVQGAYTGFEAVVTLILKVEGIRFEKSGSYHAEVLRAVVDNGVLRGEPLMKVFFDLLGFRHFFRNAYGVDLRDEEVVEKAQNLCAVRPAAESSLAARIHQLGKRKESTSTPSDEPPLPTV
jgi:hypothetical protein